MPAPEGGAALDAGLGALATRYGLPIRAVAQLKTFAQLLSSDPHAPTAVQDPRRVLQDHLADSLAALELEPVRTAHAAVDIGSGAGLPGLPLAIAVPGCSVVLLESSVRKCAFLAQAVEACSVANAEVVHARAEAWEAGVGRFDLAVVRAVSRLDVVLEYAAPLLTRGGHLVAWRGQRDTEAEVEAEAAADLLGLQAESPRQVTPYPGAHNRHLHLFSKVRETPPDYPRRPGIAAKRPLGAAARGGRRLTR